MRKARWTAAWSLAVVLPVAPSLLAGGLGPAGSDAEGLPAVYVADFVATAARGVAMNDAGDVVGTSYPDPGCGSFCLPVLETVVWRGGVRTVLPTLPGLGGITVRGMNNQGWVAGHAGLSGTTTRAVVWKPVGSTYQAIDLGVLPGKIVSEAMGIDDLGRVVGWSTTLSFPYNGSPFVWTEAGGMIDLSAQGFPDEPPLGISPGGTVATYSAWYRLDDPGSVSLLPPAPQGFLVNNSSVAINDAGDQARFLVSTSGQNPVFLFRFHHAQGTWQLLSNAGTGHLTTYGMGSINAAGDVTATVQGTGVIAAGPDGLAQPLAPLLSPAYGGETIGMGGPMNASGRILARVMVGRSERLMKLVPATPCASGCARAAVALRGKFVQDPSQPGSCSQSGAAFNVVRTTVTVKDENGTPLEGMTVRGRFLDDYWTDHVVSGTTNANGVVAFPYQGPCGVGAVAFLVDSARRRPLVFDRTIGTVTRWVIPQ
jgi:probable HAF family extracellular repeat protein